MLYECTSYIWGFKIHTRNGLSHLFCIGYLKDDWTNSEEPKSIPGWAILCIIWGITLKYLLDSSFSNITNTIVGPGDQFFPFSSQWKIICPNCCLIALLSWCKILLYHILAFFLSLWMCVYAHVHVNALPLNAAMAALQRLPFTLSSTNQKLTVNVYHLSLKLSKETCQLK